MGRTGLPRPVASLAMLYVGILIGVSFIATPAKFLAESISLAQALDVGRRTFRIFGWVELGLVAAMLMMELRCRSNRGTGLVIAVPAAVALQAFFLRPLLDARLGVILDGGEPPPSQLHSVYGLIEVGKLAALLCIGWFRPARTATSSLEQVSLFRDRSDPHPPPIGTPNRSRAKQGTPTEVQHVAAFAGVIRLERDSQLGMLPLSSAMGKHGALAFRAAVVVPCLVKPAEQVHLSWTTAVFREAEVAVLRVGALDIVLMCRGNQPIPFHCHGRLAQAFRWLADRRAIAQQERDIVTTDA